MQPISFKKLRKYKSKPKTKRIDEEYINKLEEQMEERKREEVKI